MNKKVMQAAIAGGIIWGLTLCGTTLANLYFGYGTDFLKIWVGIYPGFNISLMGSLIGLVYGFLDMFVGVYIIVWVYNLVGKYLK